MNNAITSLQHLRNLTSPLFRSVLREVIELKDLEADHFRALLALQEKWNKIFCQSVALVKSKHPLPEVQLQISSVVSWSCSVFPLLLSELKLLP